MSLSKIPKYVLYILIHIVLHVSGLLVVKLFTLRLGGNGVYTGHHDFAHS